MFEGVLKDRSALPHYENVISPHSRSHDSLNKPKSSTAETSLLVSIVEAPVYAM